MFTLLKRAAIACALFFAMGAAAPALAADCGSPAPYGSTSEKVDKVCQALSNPSLATSGVTAVSGSLASNTISTSFPQAAGRMFYATISGSGSSAVTIIYTRDNGATWAPEAAGVDGSAPIVTNKIAYAGSPIRVPLVVTEAGVKAAICPGTIGTDGATCTGSVTGTVSYTFSQ